MSDTEYSDQQYVWRHNLVDPQLLQSVIDSEKGMEDEDAEDEKLRKQELREELWSNVHKKIEKVLTQRQREATYLFLMGKKQEHMGEILGITQEAANVRLKLGLERLKAVCRKDEIILKIVKDLKS